MCKSVIQMLTMDKFSSQQDLYNCNIALRELEKDVSNCQSFACSCHMGIALPPQYINVHCYNFYIDSHIP